MERCIFIDDGIVRVRNCPALLNQTDAEMLMKTLLDKTNWKIDKHNVKQQYATPRRVGCYTTVSRMAFNFSGNQKYALKIAFMS
jgi:hypothetical protein